MKRLDKHSTDIVLEILFTTVSEDNIVVFVKKIDVVFVNIIK